VYTQQYPPCLNQSIKAWHQSGGTTCSFAQMLQCLCHSGNLLDLLQRSILVEACFCHTFQDLSTLLVQDSNYSSFCIPVQNRITAILTAIAYPLTFSQVLLQAKLVPHSPPPASDALSQLNSISSLKRRAPLRQRWAIDSECTYPSYLLWPRASILIRFSRVLFTHQIVSSDPLGCVSLIRSYLQIL
jgi:hypothetical protein